MMRRGNWVLLGTCALGGALMVASSAAGCRAGETGAGGSGGSGGEDQSSSSTVSSAASTGGGVGSTTTSTTTTSSTGSGTGVGGSGTGGSGPTCDGEDVTVFDVTNDPKASNQVGPKTAVSLKGVVAMSQKFLVSKSNATLSCLWGVFVSAPNVGAETTPYSGTIVLSYGTKATVDPNDGKSYCPKLGVDPAGDAIPDDVKPGDVLNVVGKTDYFLLSNCATEQNGSTVPQRQISAACLVEKTGSTVTPPTAHVLTAQDLNDLASPTNKEFHDKWGGVKVRIQGPINAVTQTVNGKQSAVNQYGELTLEGTNFTIGDKIYYRGYLKASDKCHDGPQLTVPYTLQSADVFSYLNFCSWSGQIDNKCTDLNPPSNDCAAGGPNGTPLMCK